MADIFSSQFENPMGAMDTADHMSGGAPGSNQDDVSNQNTVHVSLAHVAKMTRQEDGLVMFRQKIHSILTIGVLVNVEELTTKNIYTIEDYSTDSPLDVQFWKNEEGAESPPSVMEKSYIRVIGQARYDDNKPFIVAFRIEPIEDANEVFCHFLEVIHDSLVLEKRLNATLNAPPDGSNSDMRSMAVANTAGGTDVDASRLMTKFNEVHRATLNVLQRYGRDSTFGLKRHEVHAYMVGVNPKAVNEALAYLVDEGHIFSTTDEDTFKCTDF